jgi:hypothetical protein
MFAATIFAALLVVLLVVLTVVRCFKVGSPNANLLGETFKILDRVDDSSRLEITPSAQFPHPRPTSGQSRERKLKA